VKSFLPRRLLAYLAVAIATAIALPAVAAGQAATSVSISASPSPATAGQPVTLTATPSVPGTVTFSYDGQVVGTLVHRAGIDAELPVPYAVAVPAATAAMERMDVARQMRALEAEVDEAHRQAQAAGDAERARIERDLHDGAQARIVVLRARVARLARQQDDDAGAREPLHSLDADLAALLAEVRGLGSGLRPLAPGTLEPSLRDHVSELPMPVTVAIAPLGDLPDDLELAVYFCVREALQNAMKHGGTGVCATVEIRRDGDVVEFTVHDDGPGPGAADGHGIDGMRQRMGTVGGTLQVARADGGGTVVRGRATVQAAAAPRVER
jgi:signal transduction histidine kinase